MKELLNFINENTDFREKLSAGPYNLIIKEKDNRILFKYNMLDSDLSLQICQEARGCIVTEHNGKYEPISVPFYKFFNHGESRAASIDWNSARVMEKVDGSLISCYFYNNEWRVATSGNIDAEDANLSYGNIKNFRDLFDKAIENDPNFFDRLDKSYTYMFELVSPLNQMTVEYDETCLYFLSRRNIHTLQEDLNPGEMSETVKYPKLYPCTNLDDCLQLVSTFTKNQEGFVAVDKDFNRIKIKSPAYLAAFHVISNGNITTRTVLEAIKQGIIDDLLGNCRTAQKDLITAVYNAYLTFTHNVESNIARAKELKSEYPVKAEFAHAVKQENIDSTIAFAVYEQDITVQDYIETRTSNYILKRVERILLCQN